MLGQLDQLVGIVGLELDGGLEPRQQPLVHLEHPLTRPRIARGDDHRMLAFVFHPGHQGVDDGLPVGIAIGQPRLHQPAELVEEHRGAQRRLQKLAGVVLGVPEVASDQLAAFGLIQVRPRQDAQAAEHVGDGAGRDGLAHPGGPTIRVPRHRRVGMFLRCRMIRAMESDRSRASRALTSLSPTMPAMSPSAVASSVLAEAAARWASVVAVSASQ